MKNPEKIVWMDDLQKMKDYFYKEILLNHSMETVTIPKKEYEYLKTHAKDVDWELVEQFRKGLDDLKKGRFKEC